MEGSFYRRIMDLNFTPEELASFIRDRRSPQFRTSIVITPFTQPKNAEQILIGEGARHTLSSVVMGKELDPSSTLPSLSIDEGFTFEVVLPGSPHEKLLMSIFFPFFAKSEETEEDVAKRLAHNVKNGPHILALDGQKPVGMAGAIVFGEVASIYAGIIDEDYRNTRILDRLALEMTNVLTEKGVNFVYIKSRNKGLLGYARRFFGFGHLYNERVYEI